MIDFNVMTRRGRWRYLLARLIVTTDTRLAPLGDALVVFVTRGVASARAGAVAHRLHKHDALILEGEGEGESESDAVRLAPDGATDLEVLAVDLWRV